MILLDIYIIVALVVSIGCLVAVKFGDFDKFVHDVTKGQVEFTWIDKITVPIIVGITWPYAAYKIVRMSIHG